MIIDKGIHRLYIRSMHESTQRGRVFKSGNSLAIRIPRVIAERMDLHEGTPITMTVDDHGTLRVDRANPEVSPSLRDLLDRITPENTHPEEFDEMMGREKW